MVVVGGGGTAAGVCTHTAVKWMHAYKLCTHRAWGPTMVCSFMRQREQEASDRGTIDSEIV